MARPLRRHPVRPERRKRWSLASPLGVLRFDSYLQVMVVKIRKHGDVRGADFVIDHGDGTATAIDVKVYARHAPRARVKVGGVIVSGEKASPAQVKQHVARSTDMLERLSQKIARPGVQLKARRGVPLFSADPERPDRFVRKLNGKTERGVLENGVFKVVD